MNIIVTAKDFELTNALREVITEKLSKFTKYLDESQKMRVVLESRKYGQKIEVILQLNGLTIKAESIDENLYTAIDLVVDKLKMQFDKYYHRTEASQESLRYYKEDEDDSYDEEPSKITKRKRFNLKPMSEEEAVLQMELLGHNFFMFFNSNTNSMCLLYRRKDGQFGLIEGDY